MERCHRFDPCFDLKSKRVNSAYTATFSPNALMGQFAQSAPTQVKGKFVLAPSLLGISLLPLAGCMSELECRPAPIRSVGLAAAMRRGLKDTQTKSGIIAI